MEGSTTSGLAPTFFFEQTSLRPTPRRYKKLPEELPPDLRFAHYTPRIAAYLAGKEKDNQKSDQEPELSDGLGNKSLLTQINATVTLIQNTLNSTLANDEDSQRYVFEKAKVTAASVITQLARILYLFGGVRVNTPKSLEQQLLSSYRDLTANVNYVPREWQVPANREDYLRKIMPARDEAARLSDDAHTDAGSTSNMSRHTADDDTRSVRSAADRDSTLKPPTQHHGPKSPTRSKPPSRLTVPGQLQDIAEDHQEDRAGSKSKVTGLGAEGLPPAASLGHRRESRDKAASPASRPKTRLEKFRSNMMLPSGSAGDGKTSVGLQRFHRTRPEDGVSTMAESVSDGSRSVVDRSGYWAVIQFQLSNQQCEEKGWIIHPEVKVDRERETMLEWATQRLQLSIKHRKEHEEVEKEQGNDKPVVLRHYGDSKRDHVSKYGRRTASGRSLMAGQTPQIPALDPRPAGGRPVFMTSVSDGSTTIYYPSGRPAIVTSCCPIRGSGYYTLAFDDTPDSKMLAVFTPSGRGSCYHSNGVVKFLATDKEWTLCDDNGAVSKRGKWPANNAKLSASVVVQLNHSLTLRSVNHSQTHLYFSEQKETAKLLVGEVHLKDEVKVESVQLLSGLPFTSQTAKEYLRPPKPKILVTGKAKLSKSGKGKFLVALALKQQNKPPPEIQKLLEMPEHTENDADADKDLFRLQRKIRNLVDDWLEHYRLAMGITSPHLRTLPSAPSYGRREAQSAKSSPAGVRVVIESLATQVPRVHVCPRVPSAPAGRTKETRPKSRDKRPASSGNAVKFNDQYLEEIEPDEFSIVRTTPLPSSVPSASSSRPARTKSAPLHLSQTSDTVWSLRLGSCPVALRGFMLGEEGQTCRCSRHKISYITDIEYDKFIQRHVPIGQMVIVSVVSSLFPSKTPSGDMLERLYSERNRSRTQPCLQARSDPFRILLYDVATAAEYSAHSTPLLLRRHNIIPGMFLMYNNGLLVFCDHIFNGYGNARKDFQKQLMLTRRTSSLGRHLPKDFRFSPQKGRHGPRAAWGGEIGGAGVDSHGNAGLSEEQVQGSLSSLSSGDSRDVPIDRHLAGLDVAAKYVNIHFTPTGFSVKQNVASVSVTSVLPVMTSQTHPGLITV